MLNRFSSLATLARRLEAAWSAETSASPDGWSTDNPADGQCAVTAAIVHDALGGQVVWGEAILPDGRRVSHYWNEVDGIEIDLTRSQFPAGTLIPVAGRRNPDIEDAYDYVLAYPATKTRYDMLKAALSRDAIAP